MWRLASWFAEIMRDARAFTSRLSWWKAGWDMVVSGRDRKLGPARTLLRAIGVRKEGIG